MTGPKRKLGSRRWELAVAEAALTRREKALCFALLPYVRWETGEARVSMGTLQQASGWKARSLQMAARDLAARGVLSYPHGREGGRRPGNTGVANVYRLDLAALEALKGTPSAPIGTGAVGAGDGRTECGGWAHGATEMGAPDADKQPRRQLQRTTTTTTSGTATEQVAGAPGGGGGGGGDAISSEGGEAAGAAPGTPLRPGPHDSDESRRLLLEFGLTLGMADTLAADHAPVVIAAGIDWVRQNGGRVRSRQGLLVKVLTDGTALEAWRVREGKRHAAEAEREARVRHDRRCQRLQAAFDAVQGHADEATREEGRRRIAAVWRVWRSVEELARSEVVPDSLLFAEPVDATGVVEAAFEAAAAGGAGDHLMSRPVSSEHDLKQRDVAAPVSPGEFLRRRGGGH